LGWGGTNICYGEEVALNASLELPAKARTCVLPNHSPGFLSHKVACQTSGRLMELNSRTGR
jgi:hypothetical protein